MWARIENPRYRINSIVNGSKSGSKSQIAWGLFTIAVDVLTLGEGSAAEPIVKEGIYEFVATSGKTYVGQSVNIEARLTQHIAAERLAKETVVTTTEVLGGKTAREIAEQMRINTLGGVEFLENIRNPIGEARKYLMGQ